MSHTLTIGSQKGGVGKTTTALNLAFSMGRMGMKTLLIDLDPQSGTSIAVNLRNFTDKGLIDVIVEECGVDDILAEASDGSMTVAGIGHVTPDRMPYFEEAAWNEKLETILGELSSRYHYTVIDAPAGLGGVVQSALHASEGALLITNCSAIALKSIHTFLQTVDHVASNGNPDLQLEGVLLSMVDPRSGTEQKIFEEIRSLLPEGTLMNTVIPYDEVFEESTLEAVPAVLMPGAEEMGRLYFDLAMELKDRERGQPREKTDDRPQRLF